MNNLLLGITHKTVFSNENIKFETLLHDEKTGFLVILRKS